MRPPQEFLAIVIPPAYYWSISMQMWICFVRNTADLFPPNIAQQGPRRKRRAPEVTL
jgi:hypothetical protein